jgi:hypothetical protein
MRRKGEREEKDGAARLWRNKDDWKAVGRESGVHETDDALASSR